MTTGVAPFVGREREMRELLAALDDACAARGRIVLLVGQPGIGKTRTSEEVAQIARRRGALACVGRCYEGEGAPPYWPWVQVLRAYARGVEAATVRADMGGGAADITRMIDGFTLPAEQMLDGDQVRFRFFDSLTTCLKNAARRQPLVLVLDDLHWADRPSLLLLQFIAREIAGAALLLVGTYRDVGVDRRHPFLETLAELAREPVSRLVPLRGLSESDVGSFMESVGGSAPPATVVTAVHQRTEGNPFFISQLVRLLAPEGDWQHVGRAVAATIPQGVQDVIAQRLDRLSPLCLDLLRVAAVAGREFDLRVVAAAAGGTLESILEPLEEAERHRLINEIPGTVHGYSFSHVLIPEALYAGLSGRQRVQLHRAIGDALEALYPTAPDARLAELAYHFFEGAPGGGDTGKAVAYARRAAEHAKGALAYEEAARCYELALTTLARHNVDDEQICELHLGLGEAHQNAANRAASREAYLQAGTLARRLGRPDLLARAALGFSGIIIGIGVDRQAVEVLEEALTALGPQDTGLRAMLLSRLAMELFFSRDSERRTAATADAVATARRAGDALALAHALEARHFAIWGPDGPAERLALADEMMRSVMTINNVDLVMHAHMLRIHDLLELGLITEVDAAIDAYARLAEELRQPSYHWGLGMCRAMRAMMDGRFADAEELATAALTVGQRVQPQTAATLFAAQLFHLRRDQGRLAELEPALQEASVAFPKVAGWRCALAGLYAELNRGSEAAHELEHAVASGLRDLPRDNSWLGGVTLLAEACAHIADRRRAGLLYQQLLPHKSQIVVVGIASACGGAVAHPLGLLAQTLGRWDDAAAHFDQALALHRRLGARPFVARTQHAYASLLLAAAEAGARGRDESYHRARTMVDDAHGMARTLGMGALEARARALLNRLDHLPPAAAAPATQPPPRPATGEQDDSPTELTDNVFRYESDHWTLVFEGRTCRLKDAKGLRYIALLLGAPHRPMHVAELTGATTPATDAPDRETARDRLRDLCTQLEEAEQFNDIGTAARLQAEIDGLTRDLARQFGIESTADRHAAMDLLRLRVTKAIKAALRKISQQHPALGHHLQSTIRTGSFCSYVPDPTKPTRWRAGG